MGCCIAAALIASQGLTLSERVRKFFLQRLALEYFRLSPALVIIVFGAELLSLAALFQFEFGFARLHVDHFLAFVKTLGFPGDASTEFAMCKGVAAPN